MKRLETTKFGGLRTLCLAALASIVLAGCAAWPERATGGLAELYPSSSGRINDLERRFIVQVEGPAADHAPATLLEARDHLIRAKREQAAGLLADASASADRVEAILYQLELRLGTRPGARRL